MQVSTVNPHYDVNSEQLLAAKNIVVIVGQAIKELGEVPNGVLYAQLCGRFSLETYQSIISALTLCGIITVKNHIIKYVGGL